MSVILDDQPWPPIPPGPAVCRRVDMYPDPAPEMMAQYEIEPGMCGKCLAAVWVSGATRAERIPVICDRCADPMIQALLRIGGVPL